MQVQGAEKKGQGTRDKGQHEKWIPTFYTRWTRRATSTTGMRLERYESIIEVWREMG